MITALSRLAPSVPDARDLVTELASRQVTLNLGGTIYDPTDPLGHLLPDVLALVANFETDLARTRVRAGMAKAKAAGRLRGKQPKLNPRQESHVVEQYRAGEHTAAELAELFNVARSTIYRALERDRARNMAAAEDPSDSLGEFGHAAVSAGGEVFAGPHRKPEMVITSIRRNVPSPEIAAPESRRYGDSRSRPSRCSGCG